MTETTDYEPPTLTEIGSVRSLTQADLFEGGHDGLLFLGGQPFTSGNPHHGLS